MKKLILLCSVAAICFTTAARPGPGPRPNHRPNVHHITPHRHHHHHHSGHFWTGVGVGLLGGLITSSLAPATPPPPVVVGPVIQTTPQRVWVPPVYGERPVYRAGIYVGTERYIITPGYWTTSY